MVAAAGGDGTVNEVANGILAAQEDSGAGAALGLIPVGSGNDYAHGLGHLQIEFDDEVVKQGALLLAVGVGPRVGGGFRITPDARFDDGLLDSCLVEPIGRAMMLAMLARVVRGTHVSAGFIEMRRNRVIRVAADRPLPIHVDGEIFATAENGVRTLTLTCHPGRLPLIS